MRYLAPLLALAALVAAVLYSLRSPATELGGAAMGSTWSVRLTQRTPDGLHQRITHRLEDIEQQMSAWRGDSLLSRFNAQKTTDWFEVTPDLALVVSEAQEISRRTGGAFDITLAPLVALWGFGAAAPRDTPPSDEQILAALKHVGWQKLEVRMDPPALRKLDPELAIDVAAIVPGYAAEQLADILEAQTLHDWLIEVGGEIKASGKGAARRAWSVGIEAPVPGTRIIHRRVDLTAGSLATSGDYRSFRLIDGRRYGHIIDPRTGRPVSGDLASVSVVQRSCLRADALATALFVLGPDVGFDVANAMDLPALFVLRRGAGLEEKMTRRFERFIGAHGEPTP